MGGGAPGMNNAPARTSTMSNFAQAIGGGPSAQASLDLSYVHSILSIYLATSFHGPETTVEELGTRSHNRWESCAGPTEYERRRVGS